MNESESTREKVLSAAAAGDWVMTLDLVERINPPVEVDADVARAAGLASAALGRSPFDPHMLAKAASYLSAAFALGRTGSDITWPLVLAYYDLGEHAQASAVLTGYIERTTDPNERVRAGAFLAQVKEVVHEYQAGVDAHQATLMGPGELAEPSVRLDTYLNAHVARAYGRAGQSAKWMHGAIESWKAVADADRNVHRAVWLLRGADLSKAEGEDRQSVIALGEKLLHDLAYPGAIESPAKLESICAIQGDLFELYHREKSDDKASAMLVCANATLGQLREERDRLKDELTKCEQALGRLLHGLGYRCRQAGRLHEALALLRESEQVSHAVGPTCFFLAALTLETGGNRRESLAYLRRAAEDRYWAHDGACDSLRKAFGRDPAFQSVREDPEFLAIVESAGPPSPECAVCEENPGPRDHPGRMLDAEPQTGCCQDGTSSGT